MRRLSLILILSGVLLPAALLVGAEPAEESAAPKEPPLSKFDYDHWSFKPLERPAVPAVHDADWCKSEVDRFILAALEEAELEPLPEADRTTLIRRLSFDLTGLPPTPAEIDAFLQDTSPHAYQRLVDRLLASPRYGERWAQHWLDLARFAETDGYEHDKERPGAWKYRDWVIDALNEDMPYDEFVRLQVAGDELQPGDKQAAVATGFALAGPDMPDINLQDERRHMVLNEITSTIGSVFLGLTIECAQCHNHKYDPISQHDFYRLRAFFDNTDLFRKKRENRALAEFEGKLQESHLMVRGDFRRPGPQLEPDFPRIANAVGLDPELPEKTSQGRRSELARWLTRQDHPLLTRVIMNRLWQHHFGHGLCRTPSDFGLMGESPSHPELLDWLATELPRQGWSLKKMHKLLVSSATYRQASHPHVRSWNEAQRKAAAASWAKSTEEDPQNYLLARMNRQRLEGEAIRDAMLHAAGRLSFRRGGRGVMPPLPKELLGTIRKNHWQVSPHEEDHRRRSIYLFVRRNLRYPLFEVYDKPDMNASCARRAESTIAPQALVLFNSEMSLESARHLAADVLAQAGTNPAAQVKLAFRKTLGRLPTAEELAGGKAFLVQQAELLEAESRPTIAEPPSVPEAVAPEPAAALTDLCLALFNVNEFIYVD